MARETSKRKLDRVEVSDAAREALRGLRREQVDDLMNIAASLVSGDPGHGVLARGDFLVFFRRTADKLFIDRIKPIRGGESPNVQ